MAPRRILTSHKQPKGLLYLFALLLVFSLIGVSCGTTKKVTKQPTTNKTTEKSPSKKGNTKALAAMLSSTRSELSDVFKTQKNTVPPIFQKGGADIGAPGQGYRIQILSSRNASKADSVAKHFRFWADSALVQYVPEAYVLFDRPYYKVRVGDFQFHNRAQKLNRLLKKRYPGAWVVHSAIKPNHVPPANIKFNLKGKD